MTSSQHLTFMFTDIVGSTALFSRLSPQEADRIRNMHFQILDEALAGSDGRVVKNLGDGAMVALGSCAQAMSSAVQLQQAVAADQPGSDIRIQLRIGLSTGDVSREEDDYFGDPVVEAARLCAAAEPGQILATSKVRLMAGRYATERYEPLGTMSLKGLPDPVEVGAVLWDPAPAVEFPPPARLRAQSYFFGRERELAAMADAFARSVDDGPRLVLVTGEAGIGKTALATRFGLAAHERGAVVLLGRCDEHLRAPFHPFEEALDHYVAHAPSRLLSDYVRRHGADLTRIVPELGQRLGAVSPVTHGDRETDRYALFRAVTGLFSMATVVHPVVLLLDDLHWADEDSLQLLRHVATSGANLPLLVVAMYRAGELGPSHPLSGVLGSLTRELDPTRLDVGGWEETDIAELLRPGGKTAPDGSVLSLAALLRQETGGNPFFVREMLQHVAATGAIEQDDTGGWVVMADVPPRSLPASIRQVVAERVRPIGPNGHEVLQTAAVIGHDFGLDLLIRATGKGEEEVLDVLDAATAASLILETPDLPSQVPTGPDGVAGGNRDAAPMATFSFHQAIVRRALHDSLGPTRRMVLHRRIGDALEAAASDGIAVNPADLAHHFGLAGPERAAKGLRYALQAAEVAEARLASKDAVRHLEAALVLQDQLHPELKGWPGRQRRAEVPAGPAAERIDLLVALGRAQRQAGDGAYRATLRRGARGAIETGDDERVVRAVLADSRGFTSVADAVDAELVDLLEQALARSPVDHPDRALVLAALCSELQYDANADRRRELAREAEELCAALADDRLAVSVANRMFSSVYVSYNLAELLQKTESALRAAERVGDPVQLFWAGLWRTYALRSTGSEREASAQLARARAIAEQLDQPLLVWWTTNVEAVGALVAGDWQRAEQLAADGERLGRRSDQPDAHALARALTGSAMWEQGRLGEITELLEIAAHGRPAEAGVVVSLVLAYAEADDVQRCRDRLDDLVPQIDRLPLASTLPVTLTVYAEAAIHSHDRRSAAVLAERLAPWSDQVAHTGASVTGPVSHYLGGLHGVLGDVEKAEAYYEQATRMAEGMSAPFFAARTALGRGLLLSERGRAGRARSMFEQARATAVEGGYAVVLRRAEAALKSL